MGSLTEASFLIIGGTTKSGTTSLFNYFKDHPEVLGSSMKETRFFLDESYPLKSKFRYTDGIDRYAAYFSHRAGERILLEATPDYLYSAGTAKRIKESLPNARLLFIFRNPVDRFVSWYRFSKQNNLITPETTLKSYFDGQQRDDLEYQSQHLMALKQGNYSSYLQAYLAVFSSENIRVCFMEDLKSNPRAFMMDLCGFYGIDPGFYKQYKFETHNATMKLKNQRLHEVYMKTSFLIRKQTHNKRLVHRFLKSLKKTFYPIYLKMNRMNSDATDIHEQELDVVASYYQEELVHYKNGYRTLFPEHETV